VNAEQKAARDQAERLGLSFYIWSGQLHVDDGGKRAFNELGWSGGINGSYRPATDEEAELWELAVRT
jgi:hypothetical protein